MQHTEHEFNILLNFDVPPKTNSGTRDGTMTNTMIDGAPGNSKKD
jgi:hypothetical protein